jgi:thiol:disulfide interchange protein
VDRILEFCFSSVGALVAYLIAGLAAFLLIRFLRKRTGARTDGLDALWSEPIAWVWWPFLAFASVVAWQGERLHVRHERRRKEKKRQNAAKATKFTRMSMDQLLAEQREVLKRLGPDHRK